MCITFDRIDSNDALYGSDPKFLVELTQLTSTLFQQILTDIQSLEAPDTRKRQAVLCIAVFNRIVSHADPSHPDTIAVSKRLWMSAIKYNQLDTGTIRGCIRYVTARSKNSDGKPFSELLYLMK